MMDPHCLRLWTRWRHQSSEWGVWGGGIYWWGGRGEHGVLRLGQGLKGSFCERHWTRWRHQSSEWGVCREGWEVLGFRGPVSLRHWTRWRHQSSEWGLRGIGSGGGSNIRFMGQIWVWWGPVSLRHWTRWRHQSSEGVIRGKGSNMGFMVVARAEGFILLEALDKVEAPEQ